MADYDGAALSDDILKGVADIARFALGDDTATSRRIISNQIEQKRLPIFRLGRSIFARKSSLLAWIAEQEITNRQQRSAQPPSRDRRRRG